jgi:DNA-binding transcriptional ArsR family regulator
MFSLIVSFMSLPPSLVDIHYNHMVVSRRTDAARADRIFRALADRTRRDIVRRAMSGTHSVSELARLYPMSTTAVQKHVAVLEKAELVHLKRRGREQLVQTRMDNIAAARRLLDELEQLWRYRMDRVADVLAAPKQGVDR